MVLTGDENDDESVVVVELNLHWRTASWCREKKTMRKTCLGEEE